MRHGVTSNLRWNGRGGMVAWSTCSISISAPTFFQSCCSTWPLARPRGVAGNSIFNLTGFPDASMRAPPALKHNLNLDRLAVLLDQRRRLFRILRQPAVVLALDPRAVAVGIAV